MPRINALNLNEINRQIDTLDIIKAQVGDIQSKVDFNAQQINVADPIHAPSTTNNATFVWTGGTEILSWNSAYIKDKNWSAQTLANPAIKSSAKGQQHVYAIPAGTLSLAPSTYYWLGWDFVHQQMVATQDASSLHGNYNMHILCQIYTGTSGQGGTAGGGGSTGGTDLSGSRYKNF
jgi:hypothetical protein